MQNCTYILENHELYHSLSTIDRELQLYPQRIISFDQDRIKILINQSISDVGCTLWDAEIFLCYYIIQNLESVLVSNSCVLELGAGTALASILCCKCGAKGVTIQDIGDVIENAKECCQINSITNAHFVSSLWGSECAYTSLLVNEGSKYDLVIMSDVFYHHEDYDSLIKTIQNCAGNDVIISFEQRREKKIDFCKLFANTKAFYLAFSFIYSVNTKYHDSDVLFYLYHFKKGIV